MKKESDVLFGMSRNAMKQVLYYLFGGRRKKESREMGTQLCLFFVFQVPEELFG